MDSKRSFLFTLEGVWVQGFYFVHVPKEQRSKLDDKASWGYGDEEFGYRLWDPEKNC